MDAVHDAEQEDASLGEKKPPVKCATREEAVRRILDRLEKQLIGGDMKGTIGDYLKLLEIAKQMADVRPREIEITWVNSIRAEKEK